MIETFKIIKGIYDNEVTEGIFDLDPNTRTRGHNKKIKKKFCKINLRKFFTSWCSQYLSSLISNCLTSFASITDCGRVFHKSTILLVKENFLKFILQNFF
jgi:hypothetical protein